MSWFGNNDVANATSMDTMPLGYVSAIRFTPPESGQISKISYYSSAESVGKAKCFVYDDATGALIATSDEVDIDTNLMWRDYPLSATIVAGSTVRLAFMGNVVLLTPYGIGTSGQWVWTGAGALTYPNAPSIFYIDGAENLVACIYATYSSNRITINTTGPYTGIVTQTINFSATISGGTPPYNYNIAWGDGSSTGTLISTGMVTATHAYAVAGNYTIEIAVQFGGSAFTTATITGTPPPPDILLPLVIIAGSVVSLALVVSRKKGKKKK